MRCDRVRGLFGACWDDEITQAEREGIDAHFASCETCRAEYETYSRTLELIGSLPRAEASPDLAERVMARARRAAPVADRLPVRRVTWVPVTAAAALAALLVAAIVPWLGPAAVTHRATLAGAPVAVQEPVRVRHAPAPTAQTSRWRSGVRPTASGSLTTVADTLFDHSEDVEFILDPVTVRRGHVHSVQPRTATVQGERAVITF
ncbi:MAG: zf-HC2 domain-containing protein [Candidatus Eisenbacteria bacterium]|nr:zf-HC2 domain-containing protein [Candidatus Eisenbacteria bacterium]